MGGRERDRETERERGRERKREIERERLADRYKTQRVMEMRKSGETVSKKKWRDRIKQRGDRREREKKK